MKVNEASEYLIQGGRAPPHRHVEQVTRTAIDRVENSASSSLDEIDRDCRPRKRPRTDVSREGVQRDILPIVEGTTVNTRYGMVRTDHILFVAAGAFHVSKPSDLIPNCKAAFRSAWNLQSLTMEDFIRF
jgi:ATP-dependent HslUV protease ATP-binding subunit HslU